MPLSREPVPGGQALEMKMRDTLDGMEELATIAGYESAAGCFEILSIEPTPRPRQRAEVLEFPAPRQAEFRGGLRAAVG